MYDHVIWPKAFDPKTSAIYALNDIDVAAPPEIVWKLLVDAENWSDYFPPEDQVKILSGEAELQLGTRYSRVTVGFPMSLVRWLKVDEIEDEDYQLAKARAKIAATGRDALHGETGREVDNLRDGYDIECQDETRDRYRDLALKAMRTER